MLFSATQQLYHDTLQLPLAFLLAGKTLLDVALGEPVEHVGHKGMDYAYMIMLLSNLNLESWMSFALRTTLAHSSSCQYSK